jgi:hypothetical protein
VQEGSAGGAVPHALHHLAHHLRATFPDTQISEVFLSDHLTHRLVELPHIAALLHDLGSYCCSIWPHIAARSGTTLSAAHTILCFSTKFCSTTLIQKVSTNLHLRSCPAAPPPAAAPHHHHLHQHTSHRCSPSEQQTPTILPSYSSLTLSPHPQTLNKHACSLSLDERLNFSCVWCSCCSPSFPPHQPKPRTPHVGADPRRGDQIPRLRAGARCRRRRQRSDSTCGAACAPAPGV